MSEEIEAFIREQRRKFAQDSARLSSREPPSNTKTAPQATPSTYSPLLSNYNCSGSSQVTNPPFSYYNFPTSDSTAYNTSPNEKTVCNQLQESNHHESQRIVLSPPSFLDGLGSYEQIRQRFAKERKQDYDIFVNRYSPSTSSDAPVSSHKPDQTSGIDDESFESYKAWLQEQKLKKQKANNKERDSTRNGYKENIPPPSKQLDEEDGPGLMGKLGGYEEKRKQLQEQRKQEYNSLIAEKSFRSTGGKNAAPSAHTSTLPGMKDEKTAKRQKEEERNREYREFLARQRPRGGEGGPADGRGTTTQAMESPQAAKQKLRNREYNEYLKDHEHYAPRGGRARVEPHEDELALSDEEAEEFRRHLRERKPRKGWATPTYDEILQRKRQEERAYRRYDDPELYQTPRSRLGDVAYLRTSLSDGHLDRALQDEERFRALDREYESKKVRFKVDQTKSEKLLDDPNWLKPEHPRDRDRDRGPPDPVGTTDPYSLAESRLYREMLRNQRLGDTRDLDKQFLDTLTRLKLKYQTEYPDLQHDRTRGGGGGTGRKEVTFRDQALGGQGRSRTRSHEQDYLSTRGRDPQDDYQATLIVGGNPRASAEARRKEAYRQELLQQMKSSTGKRGSDQPLEQPSQPTTGLGLGLGITGLGGGAALGGGSTTAARRDVRLENFSPRSILFDEALGRKKQGGILEDGFGTSLYGRGTASNVGGLPSTTDPGSISDAYYRYGLNDPLNPSTTDGEALSVNPILNPVGGSGVGSGVGATRNDGSSRTAVHFADPISVLPNKPAVETSPFAGEEENKRRQQEKQRKYQEELKRQMEAQEAKKKREKEERERYDKKKEEEIRNYNPYGRGGGGAPMKDVDGNVLANRNPNATAAAVNGPTTTNTTDNTTDLRTLHAGNEGGTTPRAVYEPLMSDRTQPPPGGVTIREDEQSFARGGHGIFGEPTSTQQKTAQQKYQDELRKQIELKKKAAEEERERERLYDERMMKKIEEDQAKMKKEQEEEERKDREKQLKAQQALEETERIQREEKRKADERRRLEREEREKERQAERERERERIQYERGKSPPVPALRSKSDVATARTPVQTYRSERPSSRSSRSHSADVLNQLARMRQQLNNEMERIEHTLHKEQNEPLVYDPRLVQKPPLPTRKEPIDVFEVARNKAPVSVRRNKEPTAQPANNDTVNEFNRLKQGESASRQAMRDMFPGDPTNSDALEQQQRALLEQQEKQIERLKKKFKTRTSLHPYDSISGIGEDNLGLQMRPGSAISAQLLESDSTFIGIQQGRMSKESSLNLPGIREEYDGLDTPLNTRPLDTARIERNQSARRRRRERVSPGPLESPQILSSPVESVRSLNPEELNAKNEERLRKLKTFNDDTISTGDPQDILDRFMAKQDHKRPPSGTTLQDDSWMRPESSGVAY